MFGVRGSHGAIARGTIFECSCLWVSTHKRDVAANDVYPKRDCTTRGYSGRGWAHTRCTPNARLSQRPYPRRYLPIAILSPIATPRNQHTRTQTTPPPQLARPPPQHLQHHRRHRHNQRHHPSPPPAPQRSGWPSAGPWRLRLLYNATTATTWVCRWLRFCNKNTWSHAGLNRGPYGY